MSTIRRPFVDTAISPTYGILATSKSYCLAYRKRIHSQHGKFLVTKIAGHKLPVELVDLIADRLLDLNNETSLRIWKSLKSDKAPVRQWKFCGSRASVLQETVHLEKGSGESSVAEYSVLPTSLTKPNGIWADHVIVTAAATPLSLGMLIPGSHAQYGGPTIYYADGQVSTQIFPSIFAIGNGNGGSLESVTYSVAHGGQTNRLTQIDGIEAAIRLWDQEAADKLVKSLELDVVDVNGEAEGSNRPQLRLLQVAQWY